MTILGTLWGPKIYQKGSKHAPKGSPKAPKGSKKGPQKDPKGDPKSGPKTSPKLGRSEGSWNCCSGINHLEILEIPKYMLIWTAKLPIGRGRS